MDNSWQIVTIKQTIGGYGIPAVSTQYTVNKGRVSRAKIKRPAKAKALNWLMLSLLQGAQL